MLPEYPTEFPAYSISLIIQKLRGGEVTNAVAVKSAWVVCGYACSLIAAEEKPRVVGFEFNEPNSVGNVNELDLLNLLLTTKGEAVLSTGMNWALIAKLAAKLFMMFLLEEKKDA